MEQPLKVLVIEDVVSDFLLLERHLREKGLDARCHRVESAAQLAAALDEGGWEIVLADYRVPGMDFRQTLEQVRARVPDLPVILVSGTVGDDEAVELLKQGAWDFVLKDRLARLVPVFERSLREVAEKRARREAERALRESEERYRAYVENSPVGIFVADADGRLIDCNPAAVDLLGYDAEALKTMWIRDIHFEEDWPLVLARFGELQREGRVEEELRARRRDGSSLWVSLKVVLLSAGRSMAHMVDMTERRRAEEALRESEQRHRSLFEEAPVGIYRTTPDGRILFANPAVLKILGLESLEELYRRNLEEDGFEPGYDRRSFKEILHRDGEVRGLESGWTRKDGRVAWVREAARAVRGPDGEVLYYDGTVEDISERKQAEQALRESEAKYHALVDSSPDAITMTDLEGTLILSNPQNARLYGYDDPQAMQGISVFELVASEDRRRAVKDAQKTLDAGGVTSIEYTLLRKDGSRFPAEVSTSLLRDAGGAPAAVIGITRDITDRKRVADALRASEERYRVLFDNALEGITAVDPATGRFHFFNPAVCAMFGYTAEEFRNLRLPDLHPPGALQPVSADIDAVSRGEAGPYRIVPCLRKDGTLFQADISGSTAVLDGKRLVFGFFTDVTKRIQAEQALRESEERYRRIVEMATEGIWSVDWKLRTTFVNNAFARMLGYAPEEMLGTPAQELTFPEDLEEFQKHMSTRRKGISEQYERRFRRKDGRECWCLVSGTPVRDADGRFAGSFGMLTDITERRHLEEQLRQSQKMEAVGQLAGGVAHDFNNLLTVISGNAELLLGHMAADDPFRANVADIRHAGERAASLTRQLLAFSRKQILEPKILDLNDVVAGTEKMLRRLIGEDVVLTCILAPDLHRVKVDPGQMEQVIFNIAVNARDAMPKGGRLTIETRNVDRNSAHLSDNGPVRSGRFICLTISDTGCGMAPEVASRVFEPFFTTKGPGKGTGLGLATVYGIVQQSEGEIEVRSAPGTGTTFEILLPACEEAPAARVGSDARLRAVPHGTETVLLVEDEEAVRRIVKLVLDASGYKVLEASNGREALEIAGGLGGPLDLVVTDVVMPEMSGRELAERLRSQAPSLRVLFISGYTDDAVMRHGVVDGGEAFLQKPFSPLSLAKKVREVLDAED